jgi:hypothetical protein
MSISRHITLKAYLCCVLSFSPNGHPAHATEVACHVAVDNQHMGLPASLRRMILLHSVENRFSSYHLPLG